MLTCSGRDGDILRHFARNANTFMTLKAYKGRLHNRAKVYNQREGWEDVIIRWSAYCVKAVDILGELLPFGDPKPNVRVGKKPRGGKTWSVILHEGRGNRGAGASSTRAVGETPPSIVPGAVALQDAYEAWVSCDRQGREDGESCGSFRCPRC